MGFREPVHRSTLSDANEARDWRIYAEFAQRLIAQARAALRRRRPWRGPVQHRSMRLNSTTIDLCLSVFPWAPFRSTKAAIKLHTLLDLRGNIPSFLFISDGKLHEVNILDQLLPEPGAFYVMDRGYIDFERLGRLAEAGSFFVTRAKSNLKAKRRYSHKVDRTKGLICDQTVVLTVFYSRKGFDQPLRRIKFKDPETAKTLVFLTNNFTLPALTITQLYRCRWQIELFFKWIKQHLRIKQLLRHLGDAVKTQIWIACVGLTCWLPSSEAASARGVSLLHIAAGPFGHSIEKMPIQSALSATSDGSVAATDDNQLNLFTFFDRTVVRSQANRGQNFDRSILRPDHEDEIRTALRRNAGLAMYWRPRRYRLLMPTRHSPSFRCRTASTCWPPARLNRTRSAPLAAAMRSRCSVCCRAWRPCD